MSGIMLNILGASFGGGVPVGYLAALTSPLGTAVERGNLALRDNTLIVTCSTSTGAGVVQLTALKLSLDADIVWQTLISDGADSPLPVQTAIDSAGNVVVAGEQFVSFNGFFMAFVVKFDSSGVLQWQRRILGNTKFNAVAVDSSNDIYCTGDGRLFSSTLVDVYMAKYDAAGAIQYRRNIGDTGTGAQEFSLGIAVDANNFVIAGEADAANRDALLLICTKAAGDTVNFTTRRDADNAGFQRGTAIVAGETDGVFYFGMNTHATTSAASKSTQVIARQVVGVGATWSTFFQAASTFNITVASLCMDPSNTHVYACGSSTNGVSTGVQLSKFNIATGDLVWQRSLFASAGAISGSSVKVDSFDNLYVSFTSSFNGANSAFVLKMPGSGAGAGNSVTLGGRTYTYAATTHTATSSFLTVGAFTRPNQTFTQASTVTTAAVGTSTLAITDEAL